MFRIAGIILSCLALCLAGCSTLPTEESTPAKWSANNAVGGPASPTPPPPVKATPPPVINQYTNVNRPVLQYNPPPPVVTKPVPPVMTWTSLNRWAEQHGVQAPYRLNGAPVLSYAVGSERGAMVVEIGSRDATWNGTGLHLGFAPEMIDDQVFVHGLDLEKNFAPLLCEAPAGPEMNRVIVVDPGHGGMNGGTVSVVDGQPEKTFTLDWARRLTPLLEAKGWQVFLTRTNDSDIAVSNRVTFADAHHAGLFISLHFNSAAPDRKQSGLETYCLTPTGMPSSITRGYPDIVTRNFPANVYDTDSLRLALRLHKAILRATGEEDRGVRRARFLGVLQGQHCPCLLIEGGYLSSPQEAEEIESGAYRQKLAEAVAGALK